MFITNDYKLEYDGKTKLQKVVSNTEYECRVCHGLMKVRDHCRRSWIHKGGDKEWIIIRRFYCNICKKYERELLDIMVPFKHYDSEIITGVLDGCIKPDMYGYEDAPADITMKHWKFWFMLLEEKLGRSKMVRKNIKKLREQSQDWLKKLWLKFAILKISYLHNSILHNSMH